MHKAQPTDLKKSERIEPVELDSKAIMVYHDHSGNYWFSSREKGLYRYDGTKLKLFTVKQGLKNYRVIDVQEDKAGVLFFDTPNAVFKFTEEQFTAIPIVDKQEKRHGWKAGTADLWFRIGWDNKGPYRYDGEKLYPMEFPKNKMEDLFYADYPSATINPYAIYSMYKDRKGNIWFGTSNMGVYMYDGKDMYWMYEHHLLEMPDGGNFGVRSIAEDAEGNYWICHAKYKYKLLPDDKGTPIVNGFKNINYLRKDGVAQEIQEDLYFYSIETISNGDLFMFAGADGLWRNNGTSLTQVFIRKGEQNISPSWMYKDKRGICWFGTEEHGIYQYQGNSFTAVKIQ